MRSSVVGPRTMRTSTSDAAAKSSTDTMMPTTVMSVPPCGRDGAVEHPDLGVGADGPDDPGLGRVDVAAELLDGGAVGHPDDVDVQRGGRLVGVHDETAR